MKKIVLVTCYVLLIATSFKLCINSSVNHQVVNSPVLNSNAVAIEQPFVHAFAWQAAPPVTPIEERKSTNWLWWAIGVALAVGGGVLLYFLIKKDPRQDVR